VRRPDGDRRSLEHGGGGGDQAQLPSVQRQVACALEGGLDGVVALGQEPGRGLRVSAAAPMLTSSTNTVTTARGTLSHIATTSACTRALSSATAKLLPAMTARVRAKAAGVKATPSVILRSQR